MDQRSTSQLTFSDWYIPVNLTESEENLVSQDNTCIFIISAFQEGFHVARGYNKIVKFNPLQYMMLAFIFSMGPPYRTRIWRNIPFLASLFLLAWATAIMAISPGSTGILD